ncbi:MAG: hypothetical protein WC747_03810 [Candidatus Babeliales bacterium]
MPRRHPKHGCACFGITHLSGVPLRYLPSELILAFALGSYELIPGYAIITWILESELILVFALGAYELTPGYD